MTPRVRVAVCLAISALWPVWVPGSSSVFTCAGVSRLVTAGSRARTSAKLRPVLAATPAA